MVQRSCPEVQEQFARAAGAPSNGVESGNSHANLKDGWEVRLPPTRWQAAAQHELDAFYLNMLLPGLSLAFHAATLRRSANTIRNYRRRAEQVAASDPKFPSGVERLLVGMTAEDGLRMAQLRGGGQLPFWSKLAIGEYRNRGYSCRAIAKMFCCSERTVRNVTGRKWRDYSTCGGERLLTEFQRRPANRWHGRGILQVL